MFSSSTFTLIFLQLLYVCTSMNSWILTLFNGLQSVAIIYFDVQIGPVWASGSPSIWLLCPFDTFPSFFEYFLTFSTRCYRLILYFLCSEQESTIFTKESWFLLARNGIYKPIHFSFMSNDYVRNFWGWRSWKGCLERHIYFSPSF